MDYRKAIQNLDHLIELVEKERVLLARIRLALLQKEQKEQKERVKKGAEPWTTK